MERRVSIRIAVASRVRVCIDVAVAVAVGVSGESGGASAEDIRQGRERPCSTRPRRVGGPTSLPTTKHCSCTTASFRNVQWGPCASCAAHVNAISCSRQRIKLWLIGSALLNASGRGGSGVGLDQPQFLATRFQLHHRCHFVYEATCARSATTLPAMNCSRPILAASV
jgi:hypothetical protein